MIAAKACEALSRRIAREPVFTALPEHAVVTCLLAATLLYYVGRATLIHNRAVHGYFRYGEKTWNQIEQLRALPFRPPHSSRIALLNDPVPEGWHEMFIAKLWWNDHSLQVFLQNQLYLPAADLDRMDFIFDFPNGRLTRIKLATFPAGLGPRAARLCRGFLTRQDQANDRLPPERANLFLISDLCLIDALFCRPR